MEQEPDSEPPFELDREESGFHTFLTRGEWRVANREARLWRKGMDARLKSLEKKLMLFGLALAALSAGTKIPWVDIAKALAGEP